MECVAFRLHSLTHTQVQHSLAVVVAAVLYLNGQVRIHIPQNTEQQPQYNQGEKEVAKKWQMENGKRQLQQQHQQLQQQQQLIY